MTQHSLTYQFEYSCASTLIVIYAIARSWQIIRPINRINSPYNRTRKVHDLVAIALLAFIIALYASEILLLTILALTKESYLPGAYIFYVLSNTFVYCILLTAFLESQEDADRSSFIDCYLPLFLTWSADLAGKVFLLLSSPRASKLFTILHVIVLGLGILSLVCFQYSIVANNEQKQGPIFLPQEDPSSEEEDLTAATATATDLQQDEDTDIIAAMERKKKLSQKTKPPLMFRYLRSFKVLWPYIWPAQHPRLKFLFGTCIFLILLGRAVNILLPIQLGMLTDALTPKRSDGNSPIPVPVLQVVLFALLRLLQGGYSLINAARQVLWGPVYQYSYRSMAIGSLRHVHYLSLEYHLNKKSGELVAALIQSNSFNKLLEQLTFQILPVVFDMAVAVVYFIIAFNAFFGLIVLITCTLYIYVTYKVTIWRAQLNREMRRRQRNEFDVKIEGLANFESVKYFGAEEYELARYTGAVNYFQESEWKVQLSLGFLNAVQTLVFIVGVFAVCLLSAFRVAQRIDTIGSFINILTYLAQLQQPLNFFGMYIREVQFSLLDTERLLEIMRETPDIQDQPDSIDAPNEPIRLSFNNVEFAYQKERQCIKNIQFMADKGQSIALVGESGAGKSTITKLLFRFYDVDSGSITFNDIDIRKFKLESLRNLIGIVPQDSILFNDTIMSNIMYAKPNSPVHEVIEAAKMAQIHERIMSFPKGYDTVVGERGLRLSGGEKQRIAIARAILKNPRIIILDEATSALDTNTEDQIQKAIKILLQDRTSIIIAHRLSTIANCDLILCLSKGKVVESGKHEELLSKKGYYYDLWSRQAKSQ